MVDIEFNIHKLLFSGAFHVAPTLQMFNLVPSLSLLWIGIVLLSNLVSEIQGHGRLMEPVSRASAWRRGYPNPADYNDNQGYCGGYSVIKLVTQLNGKTIT